MGLPSCPEPLASLQARFPEAVRDWIDAEGVQLGTVWPPGEQRAHVFDFEDGLRLIVHREVDPQGLRLVVLAALVMDGTPFASCLPMDDCTPDKLVLYVEGQAQERYTLLSGLRPHWEYRGLDDGGAFYWQTLVEPA